MKLKKNILIIFLIFLFTPEAGFSQDDILEEINKDLEKSGAPVMKKSYSPVADFFGAMTKKESYVLYKEIYLSTRYSSELDKFEGRNSLGFILFGTFSGQEGQLGDMNVQFRASYYNDQFAYGQKMHREYTEDLNDFETELHNAYLRLRVLPPTVNVRLGHFYVPFGIQPWIDTHGTLLQSPTMEFTGVDRDWGVGLEGQNELFEYQMAITRGSGMEYFERNRNFVLAGKLSTPRIGEYLNEWLGVSFLIGRIYDPMGVEKLRSYNINEKMDIFGDNIIRRWRAGIDAQKIHGPVHLRFEVSGGTDDNREDVLGEFAEIKYALGKDNRWSGYAQFENLDQGINHPEKGSDTVVRGGLSYGFSANYNLQFVVSHDLNTIFGKKDTWAGVLFYGQKG